ncbi:hypothetical protein CPC08DRAFT_48481 [Agrocybe pediades]|nr:hypothetical protein CPC08DRAFT_48481 [Agrocybe pediades]
MRSSVHESQNRRSSPLFSIHALPPSTVCNKVCRSSLPRLGPRLSSSYKNTALSNTNSSALPARATPSTHPPLAFPRPRTRPHLLAFPPEAEARLQLVGARRMSDGPSWTRMWLQCLGFVQVAYGGG